MAMKDISDKQVVQAYIDCKPDGLWGPYMANQRKYPYQLLAQLTGQSEKVCYKCCERADDRGYIDYGVSLRTGWVTDKGMELLK